MSSIEDDVKGINEERKRPCSAAYDLDLVKKWMVIFSILVALGALKTLTGSECVLVELPEWRAQEAQNITWTCGGCGKRVYCADTNENKLRCPHCGTPFNGW